MPDVEKIVKVKMTQAGFDLTHGKLRKGGVYEFPQEQAIRYVRARVATPAPASAKTARDEDRAALMQDAEARAKIETLDQEMSAAWDIDIRDLERAELEADAAEEAAEAATEAVKRAQTARRQTATSNPAPGEVTSQGTPV